MFQTQQAQAQAHHQSHSTWDTAEETNTMDVNETVGTALPTMTSLGSMGSIDGILEDMIMSDTVLPLEATDDIIQLSTYDEDTTMEEEPMMEDAPTATAPGASRSLTRVVSKDSKGEAVAYPQGSPFPPASAATVPANSAPSQPAPPEHPEDFSFDKFFANPHESSQGAPSSLQPVTPFHPEPPPNLAAALPTVTPPTPPKPHQHPEDFSFDKFFAHYDLPSQLQPPPNPEAAPPKKKRSHRRAHTVGAYHAPTMLVEGVYPETIAPRTSGGVPVPVAVHTIPAPAEITTPVVPAAPAPPTSADPIMAFLTTNNNASPPTSTRASIDDSHQATSTKPPLKRKGHHRRIRSEGSAAFGNNNNNANLFFTNTGITNVLLELAADKPVPKDSTTSSATTKEATTTASDVARTTKDRMASTPGSLGPASLVGTALEAVPEKKAIVPEVLPHLHDSHTNHLGGSSSRAENEVAVMAEVDPRQFMNHGTEAAWLENLQNSPVAGA